MSRQTILLVLCVSLAIPVMARKKKAVDPEVEKIHKLFVKGNNEAAANMRKILAGKTRKLDNVMSGSGNQGGCFQLVGKESDAEGVLEVNEQMTAGGLEGRTTVVSGALTDKEGNVVWSDSKQGVSGIVHTGAGDAARILAFALEQAAGCK